MATGEVVSVGREARDGELVLLCKGKIASVPRGSVPIRKKERKKNNTNPWLQERACECSQCTVIRRVPFCVFQLNFWLRNRCFSFSMGAFHWFICFHLYGCISWCISVLIFFWGHVYYIYVYTYNINLVKN